MDEAALKTLLETTGLPVAYHSFKKPPSGPYIIYKVDVVEVRGSDGRNEIKQTTYLVELYTDKKDPELQAALEALLDERGINYQVFEMYIEPERMFQAAYTIRFTTKIRRTQP